MSKFFTKIFDKDIFMILILGSILFGVFEYTDYRFNLIQNQLEIINKENLSTKNIFQNKIKDLEDVVSGTKSNLTDVLEQEQQKNSVLQNQFSEITNTVGALEKLSTTDPELLKLRNYWTI